MAAGKSTYTDMMKGNWRLIVTDDELEKLEAALRAAQAASRAKKDTESELVYEELVHKCGLVELNVTEE